MRFLQNLYNFMMNTLMFLEVNIAIGVYIIFSYKIIQALKSRDYKKLEKIPFYLGCALPILYFFVDPMLFLFLGLSPYLYIMSPLSLLLEIIKTSKFYSFEIVCVLVPPLLTIFFLWLRRIWSCIQERN